jgi:hypothetical protein
VAQIPGRAADRGGVSRFRHLTGGFAGLAAAAALPLVLWHHAIGLVATDFRLDAGYLVTGWTGYGLIALGLLLMLPVAMSRGLRPEARLYPRSRKAYLGWGVSLYLLGALLASQVAVSVAAVP